MAQFVIYCLEISSQVSQNHLQIVSIESNEKTAKTIQNTHAFDLLSKLSNSFKGESNNNIQNSYRLEINNNIIQIIEVLPSISKGWISSSISENRRLIYEIGIIEYINKQSTPNISININETYMNTSINMVQETQKVSPINLNEANFISKAIKAQTVKVEATQAEATQAEAKQAEAKQAEATKPIKPTKAPERIKNQIKGPSWDDVLLEIKKRRSTVH
jgi:hypothetical protein